MPQSLKKSTIQKARIFSGIRGTGRRIKSNIGTSLRNAEDGIRDLVIDAEQIGTMLRNRELRRQAEFLPKNAKDYLTEETGIVDDSYKRRLKGKYGPIGQKVKSIARPFVGIGGATLTNNALSSQQNTNKRLKKGLVNPVLHEIRQANPAKTRQPVKYGASTYAQSVSGMAGSGRNRNSDKLRQLMEDASTLSTGGRPNPEHNDKRFYGLFGQSAINEPQKSMSKLQLQQRQIKQDLREGHANRRVAKSSSLKKGSYGNVFVSGAAVDPMMIVQPKKGRRFKGQTMGMTLVSKRAKTIRKDDSKNIYENPDFGDWATATLTSMLGGINSFYLGQSLQKPKRKRQYTPDEKPTISVTTDATTKVPTSTNPLKPTASPSKTPPYVTNMSAGRKTTPWRQFNRYLANVEQNAINSAKNTWNSLTGNNASVKSKNPSTATSPNPSTATSGSVKVKESIPRRVLNTTVNVGNTGFKGVGLGNTIADTATIGGSAAGYVPATYYDLYVKNKTNPALDASQDFRYKKPLLVNEERYDVQDKKWRGASGFSDKMRGVVNEDKAYADAVLGQEFGDNTASYSGDSGAYNVMSFEQLPERIKQEQGRFTIPVETRIRNSSDTASNSRFQEKINVVDPTGLLSMLMGMNAYNDYGEPVLGGRTMYRTTLTNSLGQRPNSYVTGWSESNSRDGQKSYSAQGAIDFYKDMYKNDADTYKEMLKEIHQAYGAIPENQQSDEFKNEYDNLVNFASTNISNAEKSMNALNQIGSRVDSLKGLQKEIENARSMNNQFVVNLLTQKYNESLNDEIEIARSMNNQGLVDFLTEKSNLEIPSLYNLSGYQNPLRRIQISRVGDKYGENLVPFSVRSNAPQTTRYSDAYPENVSERDIALSTAASFAGLSPYGKTKSSNVDNDWLVGAGLSNYQGNDPKYKNINTQAVYVDDDPRVNATHQPINPARIRRLEDTIFAKPIEGDESPYERLNQSNDYNEDQRVDNRNFGVIAGDRLGTMASGLWQMVNPETYIPGFWQRTLPNTIGYQDVSKRQQYKTKQSKSKNSSIKKSSLKQSPPMASIGDAPKITPKSVMHSQSTFTKSLNPNPKPIQPVTAKHNNKYFK